MNWRYARSTEDVVVVVVLAAQSLTSLFKVVTGTALGRYSDNPVFVSVINLSQLLARTTGIMVPAVGFRSEHY